VEAACAGERVTLMEREEQIGGQLRLAGRASAHAELWRRYGNAARRDLAAARVNLRLGEEAGPEDLDGYDLVVIATGGRQHLPELPAGLPFTVVPAWEAIEHPTRVEGPALVADWGGEWSGLDAAERLAQAGLDVELATAALHPGEQLHQFQRSLYLARLDCLGVRLRAHLELVVEDGRPALRHIFSGRLEGLGRAPYARDRPGQGAGRRALARGRRPAARNPCGRCARAAHRRGGHPGGHARRPRRPRSHSQHRLGRRGRPEPPPSVVGV
jgi:hypothetical protein